MSRKWSCSNGKGNARYEPLVHVVDSHTHTVQPITSTQHSQSPPHSTANSAGLQALKKQSGLMSPSESQMLSPINSPEAHEDPAVRAAA